MILPVLEFLDQGLGGLGMTVLTHELSLGAAAHSKALALSYLIHLIHQRILGHSEFGLGPKRNYYTPGQISRSS